MRPIATQLKMNDVVVAKALRLRACPKSSKLSENITLGVKACATSFVAGRTCARTTCWFDFIYLWFMDFDCAHRNLRSPS